MLGEEEELRAAQPRLLSAEEAVASLTCLASFAKNYLPILFNTISSSSQVRAKGRREKGVDGDWQEERPLLLETVGEYAKITEGTRLNGLFQNVMKKLLTAAAAGGDSMTDETEVRSCSCSLPRPLPLLIHLHPSLASLVAL